MRKFSSPTFASRYIQGMLIFRRVFANPKFHNFSKTSRPPRATFTIFAASRVKNRKLAQIFHNRPDCNFPAQKFFAFNICVAFFSRAGAQIFNFRAKSQKVSQNYAAQFRKKSANFPRESRFFDFFYNMILHFFRLNVRSFGRLKKSAIFRVCRKIVLKSQKFS